MKNYLLILALVSFTTINAQVYDTEGNLIYRFVLTNRSELNVVTNDLSSENGFKIMSNTHFTFDGTTVEYNYKEKLCTIIGSEINDIPSYSGQRVATLYYDKTDFTIKTGQYGAVLLTIRNNQIINEFGEIVYTYETHKFLRDWMIPVIGFNYYKLHYEGNAFEKIKERRKELGELNTNVVQLLAPESPAGTYAYFVQFGNEVITLSREQAKQLKNLWLDQEMGSKSYNPNQAKKRGIQTNYLAIRIYIKNKYKDEIRALAKTSSNNSVESEAREIPKEMSAKKVIDSYLSALGGAEVLREVKNSFIKSSFEGSKQEMTIIMEKPNKYKSIISAENYSYITVYDGINAYAKQNGEKISVPKKTKEGIKNLSLWPELNYFEDSNDIALKSIEKVNNEDCYILEITTSAGVKYSDYFSIESGLKLRTLGVARGGYVGTTDYLDYREVDGLLFPYETKTTMGSSAYSVNVTSIKVNTDLPQDTFELE